MTLLAPEALSLLLLWGFLLLGLLAAKERPGLPHPLAPLLAEAARAGGRAWALAPTGLFLLGLLLLALGAARPRLPLPQAVGEVVVLAIDVSRSMMATDIPPNRLEAAKEAARVFLREAPRGVRIGLVAFSGQAQTVHPPSLDRKALEAGLQALGFGFSTAIGDGLLEALNQIGNAGGRGRVVLLTDGRNRTGVDPREALWWAEAMGVPVYAVGVGVPGWRPGPGDPLAGLGFPLEAFQLDEALLQEIAQATGGAYYRIQSAEGLKALYRDLARGLRVEVRHLEATPWVGLLGGVLVLLGLALRRALSPA